MRSSTLFVMLAIVSCLPVVRLSRYFYNVQPVLSLMCAMYSLPALPCRLLSSVGASKAMVDYFSVGVRAILHSVKDLTEALLDPSRHAHLNGLTGMVSA